MEWTKIKAHYPPLCKDILVWDGDIIYVGRLDADDFIYSPINGFSPNLEMGCTVSHWMDLPLPPEE